MKNKNLLLGYGETLTYKIPRPEGGGPKSHPYTFDEVKGILIPETELFLDEVNSISDLAKPNGRSVAKITLHPSYLAKSYYPVSLLRQFGLLDLGSKASRVTPRKQTLKKPKENLETACLYVAGTTSSFSSFKSHLESGEMPSGVKNDIIKIEELNYFSPREKLKSITNNNQERKIEVVLHTPHGNSEILDSFYEFSKTCDIDIDMDRRISNGGLTFLPIFGNEQGANKIAEFTFLRALRDMPSLRLHEPTITRSTISSSAPILPTEEALNKDINVAVFDGGIGTNTIDKWCNETIYNTGHRTAPELLMHGSEVTSTLLFGVPSKNNNTPMPTPYCNVDHFRVLDTVSGQDPDLFDVLIRIKEALSKKHYHYLNLSLGPRLPIEDDDVNVWTSTIESFLAKGNTLATVAVGNDGELEGQNRIQPPADLVNALAVGASDSTSSNQTRAKYSCIGPGRSPGVVKPDGLTFGGSEKEPFRVFSPFSNSIIGTAGTSFASPLTLRTAIGVSSSLSQEISPLTSKALVIHNIKKTSLNKIEAGWGMFNNDVDEIIHCNDNQATIIYNGELDSSQHVRVPIPFPDIELKGDVTLKATFCFSSSVDPEHPVNYTKNGLIATFRPKGLVEPKNTKSFFSLKNLYTTEQDSRADAHKWETTLHHEQVYRKSTLDNPCFDIVYQSRDGGKPTEKEHSEPLQYTLIVTLTVNNTPEVYNAIVQKYQTLSPISLRQNVQIKI